MERKITLSMPAEKGATIIEYALIVGLVAIVAVVSMSILGNKTFTMLSDVNSNLNEAGM